VPSLSFGQSHRIGAATNEYRDGVGHSAHGHCVGTARAALGVATPSATSKWRFCHTRAANGCRRSPRGAGGESPLSEVLASPLGLALARDTYANADPVDLLQPQLTTPRAVLTDLIGAFLEHAYPERRNRDRAIRWLSWIASHMSAGSATGSRDLPWWYLPAGSPSANSA
jgi:hypothetical protein